MTAPAPRGSHRLPYVSDPSSIAMNWLSDPVSEDDLRRWVDLLADSGIDTFDQEVFSQGWTAYFRSDGSDCEYDQRLQHRRFLPKPRASGVFSPGFVLQGSPCGRARLTPRGQAGPPG